MNSILFHFKGKIYVFVTSKMGKWRRSSACSLNHLWQFFVNYLINESYRLTRKCGVYFLGLYDLLSGPDLFFPLPYLTNNPSYCLLCSIVCVQFIKLKKKWSLFINFMNLQQWEGNYEILYCACTYETVTPFFLYFLIYGWICWLFCFSRAIVNEVKTVVNNECI